jgi:hypothetical protein
MQDTSKNDGRVYVTLPNGHSVDFSYGTSPKEMKDLINKRYPGTYGDNAAPTTNGRVYFKAPDGSSVNVQDNGSEIEDFHDLINQHMPGSYTPRTVQQQNQAHLQEGFKGVGKGLLKAGENTNDMLGNLYHKVFPNSADNFFFDKTGEPDVTPSNNDQALGSTLADVGSNVATAAMAPESELGVLGRLAPYAYHAVTQGLLSKMQGGSNTDALEAAGFGAAGQGFGDLLSNPVAKSFASKAFKLGDREIGYGADPARFIRDKTGPTMEHPFSGFTPSSTKNQTRTIVNDAKAANDALAAGRTIDLTPARDAAEAVAKKMEGGVVTRPEASAVRSGVVDPIETLGTTTPQPTAPARPGLDPTGMNKQAVADWDTKFGSDFNPDGTSKVAASPVDLTGVDANSGLKLRTGLGSKGNYNPLRPDPEVSSALKALPDVGPSILDNDDSIQNGSIILKKGKAAVLAPDILSHLVSKYTAPGIGGVLGAIGGYEHGGWKDALIGGALGGGILTNPTAAMFATRAADAAGSISPQVAAALLGLRNPQDDEQSGSPLPQVITGTNQGR